jgi:hypothetical protein
MGPTALSVTAREVRSYLAPKLGLTLAQVTIGHPGAAAREQEANPGSVQDLFNLFFYRVEYDGPPDGTSDDPFYVRVQCLLTSFGVTDTAPPGLSAGEKDLRLIGEAMHWLHRQPFVRIRDEAGDEVAQLQVVPTPLSVDDINHIWATQGELPYRLSVSYEFALLPMPLATPVDRAPRVGRLRATVGTMAGPEPVGPLDFQVPAIRVATELPGWAPAIVFVDTQDHLRYALTFPVSAAPAEVRVLGAGAPDATVDLLWERWEAATGWQPAGTLAEALPLRAAAIDPEGVASQRATSVSLPSTSKGQLQLTAQRTWTRSDGALVTVRSNPLLISLHEEP